MTITVAARLSVSMMTNIPTRPRLQEVNLSEKTPATKSKPTGAPAPKATQTERENVPPVLVGDFKGARRTGG